MVKKIKAKLLGKKPKQLILSNPDGSSLDSFSAINISESYVSLIIGILVVIVVTTGGIIFLKQKYALPQEPKQEISSEKIEEIDKTAKAEQRYVITDGDDLKAISIRFYGTEDHYLRIAQANNIENPDVITVGQEIKIPKLDTLIEETDKITGNTYTVQGEEYLWDIAVKAYGDGFRWVDIAKANNIEFPEALPPGTILIIPR